MKELFFLGLSVYIYSLIGSLVLGTFRFLRDIRKWKDKEEKVHITPSQFEADLTESQEEIEVKEVDVDVESGTECHTPIIF